MTRNVRWLPIGEYPHVARGGKGPTVLMCQCDTGTWGIGYRIWPVPAPKPYFIVNARRINRPTHWVMPIMPPI